MHAEILKATPELAILCLCGCLGIVPREWEEGLLVLIHKRGGRVEAANYQPSCLLSHLLEVVEREISYEVWRSFTRNTTLMGFQTTTHTEPAIALVQHSMKQGDDYVAVLYLKSAYEKVDHHKRLALCDRNFSLSA